MYTVILSRQYTKSLKRWVRNKNFDEKKLQTVIKMLESGKDLPLSHRDHQLKGNFKEYRECHIQNDILLMYQKYDDILILLLVNIGSHSELF